MSHSLSLSDIVLIYFFIHFYLRYLILSSGAEIHGIPLYFPDSGIHTDIRINRTNSHTYSEDEETGSGVVIS